MNKQDLNGIGNIKFELHKIVYLETNKPLFPHHSRSWLCFCFFFAHNKSASFRAITMIQNILDLIKEQKSIKMTVRKCVKSLSLEHRDLNEKNTSASNSLADVE